MYVTKLYCENSGCNVREVEVVTKDYDEPDPQVWKCPGCGQVTSVHWRRTFREQERQRLKDAVTTVNAALYSRDHGGGTPVGVLLVEALPEEWKPVGGGR